LPTFQEAAYSCVGLDSCLVAIFLQVYSEVLLSDEPEVNFFHLVWCFGLCDNNMPFTAITDTGTKSSITGFEPEVFHSMLQSMKVKFAVVMFMK
jgi:hypothetical protein